MIRILLSLSALWWLAALTWPWIVLSLHAGLIAGVVAAEALRGSEWPAARVVRRG